MARSSVSLFRVLWELLRYDLLFACRGLGGVRPAALASGAENEVKERQICLAVQSATPFYWKPVRCLQRSTVTVWLMRGQGIPAEVVIGYRPTPFFSHAWVEVRGRVSNDSPVFQTRLQVLDRF